MEQALGTPFAVERQGTGRPMVLIHGLGGPRMWEKLLPLLAPHFAVASVHLPGFGATPPLSRPLSDEELAERIVASLPPFGNDPPVVAGVSYGGQLAIGLAARERVAALVVIGSGALRPRRWIAENDGAWNMVSLLLERGVLRSGWLIEAVSRRSFHDLGHRPADLVRAFRDDLALPGRCKNWAGLFRNALRYDPAFERMLQQLRVPTLIVAGAADRIVSPDVARRMHELIPGARLSMLERCGHSAALEEPEAIRDLLLTHLPA